MENKNVGLKVCVWGAGGGGHKHTIAPQSKKWGGGGHMPSLQAVIARAWYGHTVLISRTVCLGQ